MNWLFYLCFMFVLYSFLGWILEEVYCYIIRGRFKDDGFLYGPFKPMYGTAMTILIFLRNIVKVNNVLLIIMCFIVPTVIEYITGIIMKTRFKKKYWDYSKIPFNIDGLVCLKFSIYWAILTSLTIFIVQPIIDNIFFSRLNLFARLAIIIIIYITIDIIFTEKHLYSNR